jgi:hypothetical protein
MRINRAGSAIAVGCFKSEPALAGRNPFSFFFLSFSARGNGQIFSR